MSDQTARYYRLGDTVSEERHVRAVNNGETGRWKPVVVIDPEDYVTLGQLADAFSRARWGQEPGAEADAETFAAMQAAVRECANPTPDAPTKPDEPIGLGALVRDDEGDYWQRHHADGKYPWMRILRPAITDRYEHITAVEVVFEGVNP